MRATHPGLKALVVCLLISSAVCNPLLALAAQKKYPATSSMPSIILYIGDGMGPEALSLLELKKNRVDNQSSNYRRLVQSPGIVTSTIQPAPVGFLVTDSACSATEMASGEPSSPEYLGIDISGNKVESILETANRNGFATGLISDTRLTHATPAAFYAHIDDRDNESAIAQQFIASPVDVALSAGTAYFPPELMKQLAASRTVVTTTEQLQSTQGKKVVGLFSERSMPDGIQERTKPSPTVPSLSVVTKEALRLLGTQHKPIFLMVEAGQIDWAEHANDAGWLVGEMDKFDNTLAVITDWQRQHSNPQSLLVITADHDTGGFGFSYQGGCPHTPRSNPARCRSNFLSDDHLQRLTVQSKTFQQMFQSFAENPAGLTIRATEAIDTIKSQTGVTITEDDFDSIMTESQNVLYCESHKELGVTSGDIVTSAPTFFPYISGNKSNKLAKLIAPQTGVVWATGTHTSTAVPLVAMGNRAIDFKTANTQVDVGKRLQSIIAAAAVGGAPAKIRP